MPAIPKHQMRTRKQDKARQARADAKARRACVDEVWERAQGHCEECRVLVYRPGTAVVWLRYGHVDEILPKSLGGDPHDPDNCRLLCHPCHFSGPSGAHRVTVR